jgi:hypothetical protein
VLAIIAMRYISIEKRKVKHFAGAAKGRGISGGVGVDNAWEQRKPEARKMLDCVASRTREAQSSAVRKPRRSLTRLIATGVRVALHSVRALLAGFAVRYNFSYHAVA